MREIFHGWRRKIGLATLVMALAFTAAWGRSLIAINYVTFETRAYNFNRVASSDGSIVWMRLLYADLPKVPVAHTLAPKLRRDLGDATADQILDGNLSEDYKIEWNRPLLGIETGEYSRQGSLGEVQASALKISYWSIIIPLTLCSAYFLLAEPCRSTQKKDNQSVMSVGSA